MTGLPPDIAKAPGSEIRPDVTGSKRNIWRICGLALVVTWFFLGGVGHFTATDAFTSIVPPYVPVTVEHEIATPAGPGLQYLVLQVEDQRALTPWLDSAGEAERVGREWGAKWPGFGWYIIWREKPAY